MSQASGHRFRFKSAVIFLMALLFVWFSVSFAGEISDPEWVTGYFAKDSVLKKEKVASSENLEWLRAFHPITVRRLDHIWGEYTSESGNHGYVYIQQLKPLPEITPMTPYAAYSEERVPLHAMPEYEDKGVWMEPLTLLTVDGICGNFVHVTTHTGEEGYLYERVLRKAEFIPEDITPRRFCVGTRVRAREMPLSGSRESITLEPGKVYTARKQWGNDYVVEEDGNIGYVSKGDTRTLTVNRKGGRIFFSAGGTAVSEVKPEEVYDYGQTVGTAEMMTGDGKTVRLPEGVFVYLYAEYGGFYGVRRGTVYGYIKRENVRTPIDARGEISVRRDPYLDAGFEMLEQGNPFLRRYNAGTGAKISPVLRLGIPYFWGGRNFETILERQPEYTTREAWQSSPNYYIAGQIYVYGFDCIGLVKQVWKGAGTPIAGNVSDLGGGALCAEGGHVWCSRYTPLPDDWREVAMHSRTGDIWLIHHPGTHAMMYIGTLREYGYTELDLPNMAGLLDHPLFLQSGDNPAYHERFGDLIAIRKNDRVGRALPTSGGASVCIMGADEAVPDYIATVGDASYRCFDVEGSCVTVMPFYNVTDYFVYRMPAE